jgi:N6-L-threonylcarbamoyladenine synthase
VIPQALNGPPAVSNRGPYRTNIQNLPHTLRILGIETSCDETAAAVVERSANGEGRILSNIIRSQIQEHAPYGGVVPEIAARAHVELLDGIIETALETAGVSLGKVDAIAATTGPGLIGGLIVGNMMGKAIAAALGKPFLAINHLEGHALTARLTDSLSFPYLLLLVSGGHTQILLVSGVGQCERWASTIDDALGEAFDKTAKLLGLPFPGGPEVEKAAAKGDGARFVLPRPLMGDKRLDFSFSGLKTAVRHAAQAAAPLSGQDVCDLAASFQEAVADTLNDRVSRSLAKFSARFPDRTNPALVVAGGVAANKRLRAALEKLCGSQGFRFIAPPSALCTDNAAMIAWAGAERMALGADHMQDTPIRPRWPLDEMSASVYGFGRKGAKA